MTYLRLYYYYMGGGIML